MSELPHEVYIIPWETYDQQRRRIEELESALNRTQDAIGDIRAKWEAFKRKYDGWINNEEFVALQDALKDAE